MRVLLFLLILTCGSGPAMADVPTIVGHWRFYKKVFQGQEMLEPPSAPLRLRFDFTAQGESTLSWWHEGDTDHCTRRGLYHLDGSILVDEITWVDPANTEDCDSDPDMQLGRLTRTPFQFQGADLAIQFQINGDPLDMVFKKLEAEGK